MSSKRWALLAVVLGSAIVFLDSTVVNVALPRIGAELPRTFLANLLEAQSYVYYGYLLTLSSLLILAGALTDYYGRRRMFAIGLGAFGATSVLCGLAPTMELLIAFRLLQGAAGAVLVPGALSIITATFQGEERGRAFGLWAGASAATVILGPPIGGALVAFVSWRAAFLVNVPLLVPALWATLRHMPESRDAEASGTFDWLGAAVVVLAVGGLTFGVIDGQAREWRDPLAFAALAVGAIATVALPILMARSPHPLVPLGLFRLRNFTVTNVSTFLIYGALYVTSQYLALFAVGTLRYNEVAYGLSGIPGPLFLAAFSTRFGTLAARHGPRWFMTAGPGLMTLGLLWYVRMPADSAPWIVRFDDPATLLPPVDYLVDFLPAALLFGIGLAVMVAPLTTALMQSVPVGNAGVASAVNNAISRIGPQLAGALIFVAISASFYAQLGTALRGSVPAGELREQVSPLNPPAPGTPDDVAAAAKAASTDAFRLAMLIAAGLCLAGAAVNAVGIRDERRRVSEHDAEVAGELKKLEVPVAVDLDRG